MVFEDTKVRAAILVKARSVGQLKYQEIFFDVFLNIPPEALYMRKQLKGTIAKLQEANIK